MRSNREAGIVAGIELQVSQERAVMDGGKSYGDAGTCSLVRGSDRPLVAMNGHREWRMNECGFKLITRKRKIGQSRVLLKMTKADFFSRAEFHLGLLMDHLRVLA